MDVEKIEVKRDLLNNVKVVITTAPKDEPVEPTKPEPIKLATENGGDVTVTLRAIQIEDGQGKALATFEDENTYENSDYRANDDVFAYYKADIHGTIYDLTPNQWHGEESLPPEIMPDGTKFRNATAELRKIMIDEGNEKDFEYRGVHCEIRRANPSFSAHLCGYIDKPENVTDKQVKSVNVHGGWTFNREKTYGFDCAHMGDVCPNRPNWGMDFDTTWATYKDMAYVENQIKQAVDQLIDGQHAD